VRAPVSAPSCSTSPPLRCERAALGWKPKCIPIPWRRGISQNTWSLCESTFASRAPNTSGSPNATTRSGRPTILVLDPEGEERHRIEGFLPVDDFVSQIALALAKVAFHRQDFAEAERHYREIVDRFPSTDAAPEALYWAGVSKYMGSGDANGLTTTATAFRDRYQDTTWAKKASVWG
jgi:TolA-binding protein